MKLIGIGGLKGCGKTTIARHLHLVAAQHRTRAITHSFATPMKAMANLLMTQVGLTDDQRIHYLDNKEEPITALGGHTMRYILQTMGTEWGRDCLGGDFWSDIGRNKIARSQADLVIFDDVRFTNECEMIKHEGGQVVQLVRYSVEADDGHPSEAMEYVPDHVVHNNDEPMRVAEYIWKEISKT